VVLAPVDDRAPDRTYNVGEAQPIDEAVDYEAVDVLPRGVIQRNVARNPEDFGELVFGHRRECSRGPSDPKRRGGSNA
jgi:hypothetical protein